MHRVERIPKPLNGAENRNSFFDFCNILFDEKMRDKIVEYTNIEIEDTCSITMANDYEMQSYHGLTDLTEINAFIGLLYYSGQWKANHVSVKELWNITSGNNFYGCVMSKARFTFLGNNLSFDEGKSFWNWSTFANLRIVG